MNGMSVIEKAIWRANMTTLFEFIIGFAVAIIFLVILYKAEESEKKNKLKDDKVVIEQSHYPPEPKPPWVAQETYNEYIRNYNIRNGYPEDKQWYKRKGE
jgi:predicted membrane protein